MKKFLLIAILILTAFAANAQTINKNQVIGSPDKQTDLWVYKQNTLLDQQDNLLSSRKTALIVTLAGMGTSAVGSIVTAASNNNTSAGVVISLVGGLTTLTGGVWLIVNEFKMIDTKKQLNDHVRLQLNPNGVALAF